MDESGWKKFWIYVAEYYHKELSTAQITMYSNDMKGCDSERIKQGFERYRNSKGGEFIPLPSVLKKYAGLLPDEDAEAQEVVSVILKCMPKFGRDQGWKAKDFMGEFAWSVVDGVGGWYYLCGIELSSSVRAQIRDMAKGKMHRATTGRTALGPGSDIPKLEQNPRSAALDAAESNSNVQSIVSDALEGKSPSESDYEA